MAYIAAADFRQATVKDYTKGLELSTTEASDSLLTNAIARLSRRFDELTNDHFEAGNAQTIDITVQTRSRFLLLPHRTRAVTSVSIRKDDETLTLQDSLDYRLKSSLNGAGDERTGDIDYIEVKESRTLSTGSRHWPEGTNAVRVVGDLHWLVTPGDVKRAVALMVWDDLKPLQGDQLNRVERWRTNDIDYDRARSTPTGIPPADLVIARYTSARPVLVR